MGVKLDDQHFGDPFEILGVDLEADAEQLKAVFRQKSKEYHPDLFPGDAEKERKFKAVNWAYEVLTDPEQRAMWETISGAGGRLKDTGDPLLDAAMGRAITAYTQVLNTIASEAVARDGKPGTLTLASADPVEMTRIALRENANSLRAQVPHEEKMLAEFKRGIGRAKIRKRKKKKKGEETLDDKIPSQNALDIILRTRVLSVTKTIKALRAEIASIELSLEYLEGFGYDLASAAPPAGADMQLFAPVSSLPGYRPP